MQNLENFRSKLDAVFTVDNLRKSAIGTGAGAIGIAVSKMAYESVSYSSQIIQQCALPLINQTLVQSTIELSNSTLRISGPCAAHIAMNFSQYALVGVGVVFTLYCVGKIIPIKTQKNEPKVETQ